MIIVVPPCHPWEPVKVPGEAAARVHCLICAEAFAAQPSPARGRRSYERPAPVCQLGLSLVTVLTWVDLQREAAARGPSSSLLPESVPLHPCTNPVPDVGQR